jgi:hypothetical protein
VNDEILSELGEEGGRYKPEKIEEVSLSLKRSE